MQLEFFKHFDVLINFEKTDNFNKGNETYIQTSKFF